MTTEPTITIPRKSQLLFVQKEIQSINNNPILNKTTEIIVDDSDISRFNVLIKPNEGLYVDLSIPFELTVPENYPAPGHPIIAKCLESIYHPNIFSGGRLCLKYDGIGSLESGFKESLENLIVALNYLFMHPENYGYGDEMPENMKKTITENLEAYRKRVKVDKTIKIVKDQDKKNSSDHPLYKMREVYGTNINPSLEKIKDWITYFPIACTKGMKKSRYYMYTFNGRKIMDIETLENVLSQLIHDPRYHFDTISNISFTKNCYNISNLCMPATPHNVVLSKHKRLVYATDIIFRATKVVLDSFLIKNDHKSTSLNGHLKILCNIVIKSNYAFAFVCQNEENPDFPVITSKPHEENKGEHVMTIDQCIYYDKSIYDNHYLVLGSDPDPIKTPWFNTSYSCLTLANDIAGLFINTAFKFNPSDKNEPYLTLNRPPYNDNIETQNRDHFKCIRILTEDESKLVSKLDNENTPDKASDENYYDIELASKYLASSAEDTGLDLRGLDQLT